MNRNKFDFTLWNFTLTDYHHRKVKQKSKVQS